ncbi:MAG TPA: hypothetical protein VMB50_03375 [Myxococcales bacterium]|nr:hypothetical protein [Myxococcales bacterium]
MIRSLSKTSKSLLLAIACVLCLAPAAARAQVEVVVGPPPEVLATLAPVYYQGQPAYWWGGHWYFRDAYGWHFRHDEPAYLRDYRAHHEFRRVDYGHREFHGGRGWRR